MKQTHQTEQTKQTQLTQLTQLTPKDPKLDVQRSQLLQVRNNNDVQEIPLLLVPHRL
jgi:hypothetical protein